MVGGVWKQRGSLKTELWLAAPTSSSRAQAWTGWPPKGMGECNTEGLRVEGGQEVGGGD